MIWKICSTWVIWYVYFSWKVVSDDEWLLKAGILLLLLNLSVLFMWDALSLKDLCKLLFSGEMNLTDLKNLKPSEISFVVHISSPLCSCFFPRQIRLEELKSALGCEGEISSLSIERNNCCHYVPCYYFLVQSIFHLS